MKLIKKTAKLVDIHSSIWSIDSLKNLVKAGITEVGDIKGVKSEVFPIIFRKILGGDQGKVRWPEAPSLVKVSHSVLNYSFVF